MRRHEKEGFSRGDVQGRINMAYRAEQEKRTPANGKYPGCDARGAARGAALMWGPADRFRELKVLAYERRYFRFRGRVSLRSRLEGKLSLLRILDLARYADKPRLP